MPPELDQMNPGMEPQGSEEVIGLHGDEPDREGAMAKADLFKLANYSHKLFQQIDDNDQLEGWVQAKITKAADYVASVYHYLEYEMKFSDYGKALDDSDVLSEGQKSALKNKLMEAKSKVKELKKAQAEKVKEKKMAEGVLSGGHTSCTECGGTGMVYEEPKAIPDHVKSKVATYNRQAKAFHAAGKRIDKNNDGIDDRLQDPAVAEETSSTGGKITRPKPGVTRHEENPDRFSDEPHTPPKSQAKSQTAADKAKDNAMDKAEEKEGKNYEKRFPGSVTRVKDGKKVDDALKGGQKKLDVNHNNKIDGDDLAALRANKKVKEAAPSAGLSKAQKSATAKKAAAGKDIGKPGKTFAKTAKAAGGGEKGEKIAAAAMWKNIKRESHDELAEAKAKATKDWDEDGTIETGAEEHAGSVDKAIKANKAKDTVKESVELDRIKHLTKFLRG